MDFATQPLGSTLCIRDAHSVLSNAVGAGSGDPTRSIRRIHFCPNPPVADRGLLTGWIVGGRDDRASSIHA